MIKLTEVIRIKEDNDNQIMVPIKFKDLKIDDLKEAAQNQKMISDDWNFLNTGVDSYSNLPPTIWAAIEKQKMPLFYIFSMIIKDDWTTFTEIKKYLHPEDLKPYVEANKLMMNYHINSVKQDDPNFNKQTGEIDVPDFGRDRRF